MGYSPWGHKELVRRNDAAKHEQALGFVNSVITIFLFSAWLHLLRPYYLCEGFYGDKH